MTEPGGEMWRRLLFRDYLRADPGEARRYAVLKRDLADRYGGDREAYTAAKSAYVDEIMTKAAQAAGSDRG